MTYGDHQEAVSAALLGLLDHPPRTLDVGERVLVLSSRRQAHLAILERLGELGAHRHLKQPRCTDRAIAAAHHPLQVLVRVVQALLPTGSSDLRPGDVLGMGTREDPSSMVDLWRAVGTHLTLGTADLTGAHDQSWRRAGPNWHLIGDLAVTVEALVVLDERLSAEDLVGRIPTDTYLGHRLAAGDVARVARWQKSDPSPDLAFAAAETILGIGCAPRIHLVRRPEDFALAQRALASFMRPRPPTLDPAELIDRPGLLAARTIAAGQVRLAEAFGTWADRAGQPELAQRFRSRIPLYAELHRSTVRLVEIQKTTSPLVVAQQSELIQQLRTQGAPPLPVASLCDLDIATHELTVNTGRTLRREGMQRRNILILDTERLDLPGGRPITSSRNRFNLACRELAQETPYASPVNEPFRILRRELEAALAQTPFARGRPGTSVVRGLP